ncbi:MAG: insulinase family protein [Candidatus Sumerlaeia bacterium]
MAVHVYRLDNGLTVYLSANHETPRFFAQIAVRAGSKMDPPDATGLAHYFEHLMFKGTDRLGTLDFASEKPLLDRITELYERHFAESDPEKRKEIYAEINRVSQQAARFAVPNEMDRLYSAMGAGHLNAHTWLEETVFETELPANRLRQWARIEAERFRRPVMRLFHTELETVYEEKNRALDNKERALFYAVEETLYKVHPYRQPTLGTIEHLKRPSIKKIYEFFNTWYVPENMCIAISGDIDPVEAIQLIDAEFSAWKPGKAPRPKYPREKPIKNVERVTVRFPGEEKVLLAFRTVPFAHKDREALMLLDMILDNSVAGLINLNLVQTQKVRAAGSYPFFYNDAGAQYLWAVPKQGQTLEEAEALLLAELEKLRRGEFEDWVIPAIITDFKKRRKQELEDNEKRAARMAGAFLHGESWVHNVEEIARLERLTKKDVVRVAQKYFSGGYVAGWRRDGPPDVPQIEKPQIDRLDIDPSRQSEFGRAVLAMAVEPIEPKFVVRGEDYKVLPFAPGVDFYWAPNPLNDLFTLTLSVDKGFDQDPRLRTAAQLLEKSGTPRFDNIALQKEWYKLGTEFSIEVGDDETRISISGLDENLEPSAALLFELLREPRADRATLDELVKIILAQREDAKKDPHSVHRALVLFNRLGADSEFLKVPPSDRLRALTVSDLHSLTTGLLTLKHTIEYTGSLNPEAAMAIVGRHHKPAAHLADPPPYHRETIRKPAGTEIYFIPKETAQAQIRLECAAGTVSETLMPAIELYNDYFAGGMSSVVFQEIREARALAYAAGALFAPGSRAGDENLMIGALGTQADKTPEALRAFIQILNDLPLNEERFEQSKATLDNQYRTQRLGFREVIAAARAWERLGLPGDPRPARWQAIRTATMDTLRKFQNDFIARRPLLISILGDKSRIGLGEIEQMGPVRELQLKDIFVE